MGLQGEEEQNVKVRQDLCYIITKFPLSSIFFFFSINTRIAPDLLTSTSPRNRVVQHERKGVSDQHAGLEPGSKSL